MRKGFRIGDRIEQYGRVGSVTQIDDFPFWTRITIKWDDTDAYKSLINSIYLRHLSPIEELART